MPDKKRPKDSSGKKDPKKAKQDQVTTRPTTYIQDRPLL